MRRNDAWRRRSGPDAGGVPGPAPGRSGGFTLVEVLVALAIISLTLFTLLVAVNDSLRKSYTASRYRTARLLAEEKMGEVYMGLIGNEMGREMGTFEREYDSEGGYPDVRWELLVNEHEWNLETTSDTTLAEEDEEEPQLLRRVRLRTWFEGFEGTSEGEVNLEAFLPFYGEASETGATGDEASEDFSDQGTLDPVDQPATEPAAPPAVEGR
jgi:prepilin-type N-terminal cleavage/methylation domain-containing protein